MNTLTQLERDVLEMLLEGDDDVLIGLKKQLNSLRVIDRKNSGVGFFTTFNVMDVGAKGVDKSFKLGDVYAELPGLQHGAGFLLYVTEGKLEMLEAYSYDEQWPNDTSGFMLFYINGQRDFEKLKLAWS